MVKQQSKIALCIFFFCIFWLIFIFLNLPHLIWQPGVVLGWFVSKGLIFYKDFTNPHFPLATFFALPFLVISRWNLQIEPLLSLVVAFSTLFVLYNTCRRIFSPAGIAACLLFFTLLFYYFSTAIQYSLEAVLGLLIAINFYLLVLLVNGVKMNKWHIILIGAGVSTTVFFGQISTLVLGVFSLFFILLSKKPFQFVIGSIVPFVLFIIYFSHHGALQDFLYQNFFYYFIYAKLARVGSPLSDLPWGIILGFYTPLIVALFLLKEKIVIYKKKIFHFLIAASFVSIPTIVFSVFHPHHFLYVLPLLAILAGLIADLVLNSKSIFVKTVSIFVLTFFLQQIISTVLPWYFERVTGPKRPGIVNDVLAGTTMYDAVQWVKDNTPKKSRILVAGDMLFYFRSERLPSNNLQAVLPWHYKPLDQTALIIKSNRPDYWIIDLQYLERLSSAQGWNSPEITNFINEELKFCYKEVTRFSEWQIWKKQCS